jgi:hypothetical protein
LVFLFIFIAHFLLVENTYKNPYSLKAVNRSARKRIYACKWTYLVYQLQMAMFWSILGPRIRDMDLTLKVLEESTQWANLAALYIGLMKESIREDMRTSDCPIVFWDYCAEQKQQHEDAQINAIITANLMSHMKLPPPPPPPPSTIAPVIAAAPSISATSAGPSPQKIAQRLATMMKTAGH